MSPASEKQLRLIERLIPEKLADTQAQAARDRLALGLTRENASAWIEKLLGLPNLPPAEGSDLAIAVAYLEEREKAGASDFEKGLLEQYRERGSLSPRQIEVCVDRVTRVSGSNGGNGNGTTKTQPGQTTITLVPAGRYAVELDGELVLVRIWRGDRNPNVQHAYAVNGTEKGVRMRNDVYVARLVTEIAKDPVAAAIAFGHRTGSCSKCGLALSNNLTRFMGIGPVCIKQFADDDTRLDMTWKAREALRAAGIDPKGAHDDLSAVTR